MCFSRQKNLKRHVFQAIKASWVMVYVPNKVPIQCILKIDVKSLILQLNPKSVHFFVRIKTNNSRITWNAM